MFLSKVIISIFFVYLLLVIFLNFYQRKLLYHPNFDSYIQEGSFVSEIEKVNIFTSDNHTILGWFHKKHPSKKTILFLHGNAGSLENRIYKLNHFKDLNLNFLIIAWRGFSGSTGKSSEKGLYEDARSAVKWLESNEIYENNIIIYGESLGTGVAIEIAQDKNFAGIILESPFTSMIDAGKDKYPYLPVRLLLKDKYESDKKIKNINSPILVMHGKIDKLVPFHMGQKMYQLANEPKYSYFSEYDNHMMEYNEKLLKAMQDFIYGLN